MTNILKDFTGVATVDLNSIRFTNGISIEMLVYSLPHNIEKEVMQAIKEYGATENEIDYISLVLDVDENKVMYQNGTGCYIMIELSIDGGFDEIRVKVHPSDEDIKILKNYAINYITDYINKVML